MTMCSTPQNGAQLNLLSTRTHEFCILETTDGSRISLKNLWHNLALCNHNWSDVNRFDPSNSKKNTEMTTRATSENGTQLKF